MANKKDLDPAHRQPSDAAQRAAGSHLGGADSEVRRAQHPFADGAAYDNLELWKQRLGQPVHAARRAETQQKEHAPPRQLPARQAARIALRAQGKKTLLQQRLIEEPQKLSEIIVA